MISRDLANIFQEYLGYYNVLGLFGPRQAGKTTFVRSVMSELPYVNFEDLSLKERAKKDPKFFLEQYSNGAIFDEAQEFPELFSYLQVHVDDPKCTGKFILTGSHNFLLHNAISQSLAGRVGLLHMLPFSISELKHLSPPLNTLLFQGGYPKIYDKHIHPQHWFPSYMQTYVERDVRSLINIKDTRTFQIFLKMLAGQVGQVINFTNIANSCGVSYQTIKSWVQILEKSYIITLIKPYHNNFKKRITKMPKLYFLDTGLLCYLLELRSDEQLPTHFAYGKIFESFIISEIIKGYYNRGLQPPLYYFRDSNGKEIDLLIEEQGKLTILEIKSSRTIHSRMFKSLQSFQKLAGDKVAHQFLIAGVSANESWKEAQVMSWKNVHELFTLHGMQLNKSVKKEFSAGSMQKHIHSTKDITSPINGEWDALQ